MPQKWLIIKSFDSTTFLKWFKLRRIVKSFLNCFYDRFSLKFVFTENLYFRKFNNVGVEDVDSLNEGRSDFGEKFFSQKEWKNQFLKNNFDWNGSRKAEFISGWAKHFIHSIFDELFLIKPPFIRFVSLFLMTSKDRACSLKGL